jgi:hypothetical protein
MRSSVNRFYPWPHPFTFGFLLRLKRAALQTIAALCIGSILSLPACTFFQTYTPGAVQTDTAGVVSATRLTVLAFGPVAETTLNAYIATCHTFLTTLAAGIQAGTASLPTPATIQADLLQLAQSIGNPIWAINMAGNLSTTYARFYASVSSNSPNVYAYVNAFANGTV